MMTRMTSLLVCCLSLCSSAPQYGGGGGQQVVKAPAPAPQVQCTTTYEEVRKDPEFILALFMSGFPVFFLSSFHYTPFHLLILYVCIYPCPYLGPFCPSITFQFIFLTSFSPFLACLNSLLPARFGRLSTSRRQNNSARPSLRPSTGTSVTLSTSNSATHSMKM